MDAFKQVMVDFDNMLARIAAWGSLVFFSFYWLHSMVLGDYHTAVLAIGLMWLSISNGLRR